MNIEVVSEDVRSLASYASIPIAYLVDSALDVDALTASGASRFESRPLDRAYLKDYDLYAGNSPLDWPTRFDVSAWAFFGAFIDGRRVGGIVVAIGDHVIDLAGADDDVGVVYDLRVEPAARRAGVGSALLHAAEAWSKTRGLRRLVVETQHVNVPACRFYAKHGYTLDAVNRAAYRDLPDEIQLLWRRDLK
jgi:ribosomal protein S18 acetylase RimI-like enzyme